MNVRYILFYSFQKKSVFFQDGKIQIPFLMNKRDEKLSLIASRITSTSKTV